MASIYRNRFWIASAFTVTIFYLSYEIRKDIPFLNVVVLGVGIYSCFFIKSKFRISHGQIIPNKLPLHPSEKEDLNWVRLPRIIPTNSISTSRIDFDCSLCKHGFKKGTDYHCFVRKGASRPKKPAKFCSSCAQKIPGINTENIRLEDEEQIIVEASRESIKAYYLFNSLGPEEIIKISTPEQNAAASLRSIKIERFADLTVKTIFWLYMIFVTLATISKPFRNSSSHPSRHHSYSSGKTHSYRPSQARAYSPHSYSSAKTHSNGPSQTSTYSPHSVPVGVNESQINQDVYYEVLKVIDGDTVELNTIGKVRLIGVDTPETVHPRKKLEYLGPEASRFLSELAHGKKVRIEYDDQRKDKYGRILGYLYLNDNTSLNEQIIKEGFSSAYIKYKFKKSEDYQILEAIAKTKRKGLWAHTYGYRTITDECSEKTCAEITSCSEAYFLLSCGLKQLDGDKDGVPCENLCL
jgi:endonuclease YncB( thermonuclease family)